VLYERVIRPILFRGDPEPAHDQTLTWLERASRHPRLLALVDSVYRVDVPTRVFGLSFPNPVGLAPGLDKDGRALPAWQALGFGFIEVGTVTWHGQPGNPAPRLFRLPASEAVINRIGFANRGAEALARQLDAAGSLTVPLGVSLGKSAVTPVAAAAEDYLASLRRLYRHGDYFVVNVSSPNTEGLRSLQGRDELSDLLGQLRAAMRELAGARVPKPLLVKVAPDLTDAAIADALEVCEKHEIAGVVATNTTIGRDGIDPRDADTAAERGGLSGRPLAARARDVVAFIHRESGSHLPIIGVGGICAPDDAMRLFDAGASLVQLCTGLIFHGPSLVRRINRAVRRTARPG
jgi:dihydroorotate dehydrogenase